MVDSLDTKKSVENLAQPSSIEKTPKTAEKTTEAQKFDVDNFLKQIQSFDKNTTIKDKKLAKKELLKQNENELIKQIWTKEFENKIKKARQNPTNSENAYVLQIYAKYALKDESVSVDGIYGKQTNTVLRYVQSEWIGWVKREVTLTAEQRNKINSYKEQYEKFKTSQDEAQKIAQENASKDSEDVSWENHAKIEEVTNKVINENPQISKYINTGKEFQDSFSFTNNELKKLISDEEIQNMMPQKMRKYFERDEIKKDILESENFPKWKKERILKRLENQKKIVDGIIAKRCAEIQANLFKQAKENAVRWCLHVLEELVDQTVFSWSQKEQFWMILANAKPEDINFDENNLTVSSMINGKKIELDYNIIDGSLSMTELLHKENWWIIVWDETKKQMIITKKLPSFEDLIKESHTNISSKIWENCTQQWDIQDAFLWTREPEIKDKNIQKEVIAKNLSKNIITNELAKIFDEKDKKIIWEAKKDSYEYKLYDIFFHTFSEENYKTKDMIMLDVYKRQHIWKMNKPNQYRTN